MKRFRVDFSYGRYYFDPNEQGDWVRFEDAQAEIADMAQTIKLLRDGLTAVTLERDALKGGIHAMYESGWLYCGHPNVTPAQQYIVDMLYPGEPS